MILVGLFLPTVAVLGYLATAFFILVPFRALLQPFVAGPARGGKTLPMSLVLSSLVPPRRGLGLLASARSVLDRVS
jgi:hypothetical protein